MPLKERMLLRTLASLHGIQTSYRDGLGRRRSAPPEVVRKALAVLGGDLAGHRGLETALAARREEIAGRLCEPVTVVWEGRPAAIPLRFPKGRLPARLTVRLLLESGTERVAEVDPSSLPLIAGTPGCDVRRLLLARRLPAGYHDLTVKAKGRTWTSRIMSAPRRAAEGRPGGSRGARGWGLFAPLYAVHSGGRGAGTLDDLEGLLDWVANLGGDYVATLPLFPTFLEEPFEPSPYLPVSRLFWSEFYLDPPQSASAPSEPQGTESLVDFESVMAVRRSVLEREAERFFHEGGAKDRSFKSFLADRPEAEDYALFRAVHERRRTSWHVWGGGALKPGDARPEAVRYHLYVQWALARRMASLREREGAALYLDLPLGIHPDGYDAWRHREAFAWGAAAGAPPDTFFRKGQNWGFPPLHPERSRAGGHRYLAAVVRHLFGHAGVVRLDHVMALHRLFWIPDGAAAHEGLYVRYPAEEFFAIVCLESRRSGTMVVGEDLGTVPAVVRAAMSRHGIYRSGILSMRPRGRGVAFSEPPAHSVASLNTHDMPTFAGWLEGRDIEDRLARGLVEEGEAVEERRVRRLTARRLADLSRGLDPLQGDGDTASMLRTCLARLAAGRAKGVLVALEDLVGEVRQQNVPGTSSTERPNWRGRMRESLAELLGNREVNGALEMIGRLRRG